MSSHAWPRRSVIELQVSKLLSAGSVTFWRLEMWFERCSAPNPMGPQMSTSACRGFFRSIWAKPFGPSCHKETDYALIRSTLRHCGGDKENPYQPPRKNRSFIQNATLLEAGLICEGEKHFAMHDVHGCKAPHGSHLESWHLLLNACYLNVNHQK